MATDLYLHNAPVPQRRDGRGFCLDVGNDAGSAAYGYKYSKHTSNQAGKLVETERLSPAEAAD